MTACKRFEGQIFDYLDDLLPNTQKKEIEKHFEECSRCSNAFKEIKNIRSLLRRLKTVKTSSDFETVLRTRISMERSLSRRGIINLPIKIPLYAAAGALLIIAASFILGSTNNFFHASNSNEPSTLVPSYSTDPNLSIDSSPNFQNLPEKVNYPMDWVNLSGRGASINSYELDNYSSAISDSIRDSIPAKKIHTVEF
ncbi:MAG: anti-sigma factor family protein [bacterium]